MFMETAVPAPIEGIVYAGGGEGRLLLHRVATGLRPGTERCPAVRKSPIVPPSFLNKITRFLIKLQMGKAVELCNLNVNRFIQIKKLCSNFISCLPRLREEKMIIPPDERAPRSRLISKIQRILSRPEGV